MIPAVRRIIATWVVVMATVALLAGCGNSNPAASSEASTPVPARDSTYANAVNLRAGDVPGLEVARVKHQSAFRSGPLGTVVEKCDGGLAGSGDVIGISSQSFARSDTRHTDTGVILSFLPIERVHSTVYLTRSPAVASRAFSAAESARARSCLEHLVISSDATATREGATASEPLFTHVEVSSLPSPLRRVPVYGLRTTSDFAIEVPGTTGRSKYDEDSFGFMVGRAVITLRATGDPHPVPTTTERRLLALLYRRAEANQL